MRFPYSKKRKEANLEMIVLIGLVNLKSISAVCKLQKRPVFNLRILARTHSMAEQGFKNEFTIFGTSNLVHQLLSIVLWHLAGPVLQAKSARILNFNIRYPVCAYSCIPGPCTQVQNEKVSFRKSKIQFCKSWKNCQNIKLSVGM